MDLSGETLIPVDRATTWAGLNDPEVLKAAIPGCETLEKLSDTQLRATVALKLGPIKARFAGEVTLSEIDAPNSYVITGEGQGGLAGFAKGSARVSLEDTEDGTRLIYAADAQIGGKIAQLGARLIESTAKKLAAEFFEAFGKAVVAHQAEA